MVPLFYSIKDGGTKAHRDICSEAEYSKPDGRQPLLYAAILQGEKNRGEYHCYTRSQGVNHGDTAQ